MKELAGLIRGGAASGKLNAQQRQAKELRDRAFTHLDGITGRVRDAGRYAFRESPSTAGKFVSEYLRRRRNAQKKAKPVE